MKYFLCIASKDLQLPRTPYQCSRPSFVHSLEDENPTYCIITTTSLRYLGFVLDPCHSRTGPDLVLSGTSDEITAVGGKAMHIQLWESLRGYF